MACGFQTDDEYVVTGGENSHRQPLTRVISFNKTGHSKTLPDLNIPRVNHACGKFVNEDGATVSFIARWLAKPKRAK